MRGAARCRMHCVLGTRLSAWAWNAWALGAHWCSQCWVLWGFVHTEYVVAMTMGYGPRAHPISQTRKTQV
jgi:hypothetical protein